jgi:hypothetical protein
MPFRSIVAEPHDLAKLANAFDAAWIGVNSVHTIGRGSKAGKVAPCRNHSRTLAGRPKPSAWRAGGRALLRR